MENKRYFVISTCGFYTAEGNYDAVNARFDRMYGQGNYETIYGGEGELFRVPRLRKRGTNIFSAFNLPAGNTQLGKSLKKPEPSRRS